MYIYDVYNVHVCMYLIQSEIPALLCAGHHPCHPPCPYCIEEVNEEVPFEDCWYARPQLLFTCYLRPTGGRPQRVHPTVAALMTSVTAWSSSAPLRS
jgi:hypothetical protein